jgi:ribose 5-phosphate isomerase
MKLVEITDAVVCQAYHDYASDDTKTVDVLLAERTKAPVEVVNQALTRVIHAGLAEFSVSARTGTLTDTGRLLVLRLGERDAE